MKNIAISLFAVAVLVGCGDNTPVQTVDWYKNHKTELQTMLEKCKADPGQLEFSANCINAKQAEKEKSNARRGWVTPNAVDFGEKGG